MLFMYSFNMNGYSCSKCLCSIYCKIVGYTGHNCSEDIITCESGPCQNGGSCTDGEKGFNCSCTTGFTGRRCDVQSDPCLHQNICQNGATCRNGTCLCTQQYTGFDCGKGKQRKIWNLLLNNEYTLHKLCILFEVHLCVVYKPTASEIWLLFCTVFDLRT